MTLGGLLVFMAYLAQLYGPIRALGGLANTAYAASAGAERIIELLDEQPSVADPVTAAPVRPGQGRAERRGRHVHLPRRRQPALIDCASPIAPGQKLAVVGASGAGKTTLTKLLLRFYDPDRGRITLDGHDLRELDLADLRRNIAACCRRPWSSTARCATTSCGDARRRASATSSRRRSPPTRTSSSVALPDGYDTRIGQRGRLLSGGQRQRLAIARAMIRNAPCCCSTSPRPGSTPSRPSGSSRRCAG